MAETPDERDETIWRVCLLFEGQCDRCPATETYRGEQVKRGCRSQAEQCVNVVETGNPWRKTEGVQPPWTVLDPEAALHSARAEAAGLRAQRDAFEHLCRKSLERGEVLDAEALDCFHILTTERPKATDADRAWAAEFVKTFLHSEGVGR